MVDHCRRKHTNETPARITGDGPLTDADEHHLDAIIRAVQRRERRGLPIHRSDATFPMESCATCEGGGCPDCTDPAG